jgi:hypothetical protein
MRCLSTARLFNVCWICNDCMTTGYVSDIVSLWSACVMLKGSVVVLRPEPTVRAMATGFEATDRSHAMPWIGVLHARK